MASGGASYFVYISFDGVLYEKSEGYGYGKLVSSTGTRFTMGSIQEFPTYEDKIGVKAVSGWYLNDGTQITTNTTTSIIAIGSNNCTYSTSRIFDGDNANAYYVIPLHSKCEYEDVAVSGEYLHKTAMAIREKYNVPKKQFSLSQFADAILNDGVVS